MAKARGLEAKLGRLRELRREPMSPGVVAELRGFLADKSNFLVAEAATIAGEQVVSELTPDMVAAFHRLMIDPFETDPYCRAKIALAEALNRVEYDKPDVFLAGLWHHQEGPPPPPSTADDAAAPLRGISAFGLMRINHPNVAILLADLLHDKAMAPRAAALQALGEMKSAAALPLLRFKARLGDPSPEVMEACLGALMTAAPRDSLPFVAGFLRGHHADAAALALGESRLPDALDVLMKHWPAARDEDHAEVVLLAIAMTRLPASIDFLIDLLAKEKVHGTAVLSALAIHRHNDTIRKRIAEVVAARGDETLAKRYRSKFETQ